jgi:hypothetical protein
MKNLHCLILAFSISLFSCEKTENGLLIEQVKNPTELEVPNAPKNFSFFDNGSLYFVSDWNKAPIKINGSFSSSPYLAKASKDGSRLAVCYGNYIYFYNTTTGNIITSFNNYTTVISMDWMNDNTNIVCSDSYYLQKINSNSASYSVLYNPADNGYDEVRNVLVNANNEIIFVHYYFINALNSGYTLATLNQSNTYNKIFDKNFTNYYTNFDELNTNIKLDKTQLEVKFTIDGYYIYASQTELYSNSPYNSYSFSSNFDYTFNLNFFDDIYFYPNPSSSTSIKTYTKHNFTNLTNLYY